MLGWASTEQVVIHVLWVADILFIMAKNVDRCQIKLISIMYIWAAKASVRKWAETVVQTEEEENHQQRRSRKETKMNMESDPRQALQRKLSTMNPR